MARKNMQRVGLPTSGGALDTLLDFACAMVDVRATDGRDMPEPPGFVVENLIRYGALGWNERQGPERGWWIVNAYTAFNRYGMPKQAICRTLATNVREITRPLVYDSGEGMKLIRASVTRVPPLLFMKKYARNIEKAERLLWTNMGAAMRSQIIGAPKNQVETVRGILTDAEDGEASILEDTVASALTTTDVSVPFAGNDIHELLVSLWGDAFRRFGGVTPPQYKAERVQSAEIAADVAEAIDNVYIMIDTFNDDCRRYGVPREMVYRGYGERFDRDDEPKAPKESEDPNEEVPT